MGSDFDQQPADDIAAPEPLRAAQSRSCGSTSDTATN